MKKTINNDQNIMNQKFNREKVNVANLDIRIYYKVMLIQTECTKGIPTAQLFIGYKQISKTTNRTLTGRSTVLEWMEFGNTNWTQYATIIYICF